MIQRVQSLTLHSRNLRDNGAGNFLDVQAVQHQQGRLCICMVLTGASAQAEPVGQGPTAGGFVGGCCAEPHHPSGGGR